MLRWLLPLFALGLTLAASLTSVKAPSLFLWKTAILVGEFGHWLLPLPVLLATLAWRALASARAPRALTVTLCAATLALLLKPQVEAYFLQSEVREKLAAAFGAARVERLPYAPAQLWAHEPRVSVETFVFSQRPDGSALKLDFYRPAGAPSAAGRPSPCLLVIHSGGWSAGSRVEFSSLNHDLASRGIAVAAIDYRLAPAHPWPAARDDVRTAIAYLKSQAGALGIDPTRLVLLGRSAGGQIAQAVAYDQPEAGVRGLISLYAPADLVFAWKHTPERDLLDSRQLMRDYLGGSPEERPAEFAAASPFHAVSANALPTLLLHGERDALVWFRQSERLAEKLAALRAPHAFLDVPWATHAFDYNHLGPGGQLTAFAVEYFVRAVVP